MRTSRSPLEWYFRELNGSRNTIGVNTAPAGLTKPASQAYIRLMITPQQCRAARSLLGWKQDDLAERSSIGLNTIRRFETEKSSPHKSTLIVLQLAFENAGVEFLTRDGQGVGVQFRAGGGET